MPKAWAAGRFLTPARIRTYSMFLVGATVCSLLWIAATAQQNLMPDGQPIGTDYADIYAAGKLALEGRAAAAYDWQAHHAMQQDLFGPDAPFYAWSYPPPFLLVAAALAWMPYALSLVVWQGLSLALYLLAGRRLLAEMPARQWLWPALGFTAVFINLTNGHNGLLSAALFGLGLALLRPRPVLAGLLLGALCYKPHFGLLVPVALAAAGQWRVFGAAAGSVLGLCALATGAFGMDIWPAFVESLEPTRRIILEQGDTGWYKIQSAFAAVRSMGGSVTLAYVVQGALTLLVTCAVACAWRRRQDALGGALLMVGALLVTPYLLDYDLTMLAPALALLAVWGVQHGFVPYQKLLMAWLWVMPILARTVMKATGLPLGFLSLLGAFGFVCWAMRRPRA